MKIGRRQHKLATCLLSHSKVLPAHLKSIVEVSKVLCPADKRGQGRATALIALICAEADANGTVMMLMPDDGIEDFYKPFGFIRIQADPVLMARKPITSVTQ